MDKFEISTDCTNAVLPGAAALIPRVTAAYWPESLPSFSRSSIKRRTGAQMIGPTDARERKLTKKTSPEYRDGPVDDGWCHVASEQPWQTSVWKTATPLEAPRIDLDFQTKRETEL